jgi:hypothetical protein
MLAVWQQMVQQQQAHIADLQATVSHQRETINFLMSQCRGDGKVPSSTTGQASVSSAGAKSESAASDVPPAKVPRLGGAAGVLVPHIVQNVMSTLQASGPSSSRGDDEGRGRGRGFGRGFGRDRGRGGWRDLDQAPSVHVLACRVEGKVTPALP